MKARDRMTDMNTLKRFLEVDCSDFPDFYNFKKPLEQGLWILYVAKDKCGIQKLSVKQITSIIRNVKEISIDEKSITNSFNRAKNKIHKYYENGQVFYEIMKPGKDHLFAQIHEGSIQLFYFEPGRRYTSKRILSIKILDELDGELRIVDPYCNERTLDVLKDTNNVSVRFMTKIENLNKKDRFLRELKDFKLEKQNIEFRSYPHKDIHDRYILSSNYLVILGYSIKDLGNKESFAIMLKKDTNKNIFDAMVENFNRRWKQSHIL